jgi:hypothetical protein
LWRIKLSILQILLRDESEYLENYAYWCNENKLSMVLFENEELKYQGVLRFKVNSQLCNLARLCWNYAYKMWRPSRLLTVDVDPVLLSWRFARVWEEHAVSIFSSEVSTVNYACRWILRSTDSPYSLRSWRWKQHVRPKRWQ